jgi:hypothetical protein
VSADVGAELVELVVLDGFLVGHSRMEAVVVTKRDGVAYLFLNCGLRSIRDSVGKVGLRSNEQSGAGDEC